MMEQMTSTTQPAPTAPARKPMTELEHELLSHGHVPFYDESTGKVIGWGKPWAPPPHDPPSVAWVCFTLAGIVGGGYLLVLLKGWPT